MQTKLYINSTDLISDKIKSSPLVFDDDNLITHKLLSGEKVVQQIGESSSTIELIAVMNATNKDLLDKVFNEVGELRLYRYGINHYGYMSEYPNSEIISESFSDNERLYAISITLNLDGER